MDNRISCDGCLNSRRVISENGYHSVCCLSQKKAIECFMNHRSDYVGLNDLKIDDCEEVV